MPLLLLTFQISVEVSTEALTWVIEAGIFVDCLYLLDILRINFKVALEVCLVRLGVALRNDRMSPVLQYLLPIFTRTGSSINLPISLPS